MEPEFVGDVHQASLHFIAAGCTEDAVRCDLLLESVDILFS